MTCKRVPFTLFTFSDGMIVRVRFGCLCSSVILYPDSEQSVAIPAGLFAGITNGVAFATATANR